MCHFWSGHVCLIRATLVESDSVACRLLRVPYAGYTRRPYQHIMTVRLFTCLAFPSTAAMFWYNRLLASYKRTGHASL